MRTLKLAIRFSLREMRGGLSGFMIFLACIALGVAAIVGVGSTARGLGDSVSREGRRILGGDASFALIHREATEAERGWMQRQGKVSSVAAMRAMARRADGASALVELKAVDEAYPPLGDLVTRPNLPLADWSSLRGGAWGPMPDDALVLAFAAHIQQARGVAEKARETWRDAIAAAGGSASGLRNLARLARAWGDSAGVERALEALIERWPKTDWAYVALRSSYAQRRDTVALWQLHEAWRRARPDDAAVACDWALLCSLLDRNVSEAFARLRPLHESAPRDPQATLALAATLWRLQKPTEALKLLESLDPHVRDRRDVIFWATLALADCGRKAEAAATLRQVWHAELAPEQAALLRAVAAKVGVTVPR